MEEENSIKDIIKEIETWEKKTERVLTLKKEMTPYMGPHPDWKKPLNSEELKSSLTIVKRLMPCGVSKKLIPVGPCLLIVDAFSNK